MPPLAYGKYSRLIFKDLTDELPRLRGATGTAFIPHSIAIGLANSGSFRDESYIEAVRFTNKSCPLVQDRIESFTTTDISRSEVNFFVDSSKPDCALPSPGKAVTFFNLREECETSVLGGEAVLGLTFEPRCMVVTIAADSRRDLFDQLLAAGRPLDDPL